MREVSELLVCLALPIGPLEELNREGLKKRISGLLARVVCHRLRNAVVTGGNVERLQLEVLALLLVVFDMRLELLQPIFDSLGRPCHLLLDMDNSRAQKLEGLGLPKAV